MRKENNAILALDTSEEPLKLALLSGEKITAASRRGIKQEHYLFTLLDKMLSAAALELKDIKQICVLRGPGRFTGIRIGLTFASVMKQLNNCKISSATTLEALAHQTASKPDFRRWKKKNPGGLTACVMHAFRQEFFCQLFDSGGYEVKSAGPPLWLSGDELKGYLVNIKRPLYCIGWAEKHSSLENTVPAHLRLAPRNICRLAPSSLISIARLKRSESGALRPLYLKPARFELISAGKA